MIICNFGYKLQKMTLVSKTWCFTLNNYTADEEAAVTAWYDLSYCVYGREVSSTGTRHLQGFVTFRKALRLSALKKFSPRAHWEVARSADASIKYCKKDGDYKVIDNRKTRKKKKPKPITESSIASVAPSFPNLDLTHLL